MTIVCKYPDDLKRAAEQLINTYPQQRIFALNGNMGAGKTTFMSAIGAYFETVEQVQSPTFSIVNEYQTKAGEVLYHFDFYRIKNLNEVYDIGYEDYFYSGSYCFIEWSEKIAPLLPDDVVYVSINVADDESRIISF